MAGWGDFETQAPALAAFGADRLAAAAAYLATTRQERPTRVHPVAPIVGGGRLFVFMEPTSPKVHDLRERRSYALHSGVPDTYGTGGEFFVSGVATALDDPGLRSVASAASTFPIEDRWVLFELGVDEARCNGYGDVELPDPRVGPHPGHERGAARATITSGSPGCARGGSAGPSSRCG